MRVRLLGPVEVVVHGEARPVPGVRRRAVLAALALQPGRPVSTDLLIEIVWDGAAPATAANSLQAHVSFLRRELGLRDVLLARPPGYVLDLQPSEVDATLFEQLLGDEEPSRRAERLRAAVGLWRGRPLADLAGLSWMDGQANRLESLRRTARYGLNEARLALGEHAALIRELTAQLVDHPLDEQLIGQLMTALQRDGRRAEALAEYEKYRTRLADELGIDPGPSLRELAAQQDPATPVPAQLPPATAVFTGREPELSQLDSLLAQGETRIAASGTAGVGKPIAGF